MFAALETLAFADRKSEGRFPVIGIDGAAVAHVEVPWGSRRFTATAADGTTLCTGRIGAFSRTYEVHDAANALRLTVRSGFWSAKRRAVVIGNGPELSLQGESWPDRGWSLIDAAGTSLLHIAATAGTWSLHPDAYEVRIEDPGLTLTDVVGIVQANRTLVKAARGAAAAAST